MSSIAKKKRILVVDDEEVTTELAKTFLERHGFEVICAHDGEQGLMMARSQKPDLILLDVMLPKMDGFEVCRQLKNEDAFRKTPILMFTAKGMTKDIAMGEEVGADEYIVKPFGGAALVATIRRHLGMT
ncbi:MAG: response regulator [Candidatus Thorarchaeota archaeon]|nr:response regulator [Candidatus Thorarchaeota archaeon]